MPGGKKQSESDARTLQPEELEIFRINKELPEYHAGVREGRRQERGNWVQVLSETKEIDEVLLGRIIGEVAKVYESDE